MWFCFITNSIIESKHMRTKDARIHLPMSSVLQNLIFNFHLPTEIVPKKRKKRVEIQYAIPTYRLWARSFCSHKLIITFFYYFARFFYTLKSHCDLYRKWIHFFCTIVIIYDQIKIDINNNCSESHHYSRTRRSQLITYISYNKYVHICIPVICFIYLNYYYFAHWSIGCRQAHLTSKMDRATFKISFGSRCTRLA